MNPSLRVYRNNKHIYHTGGILELSIFLQIKIKQYLFIDYYDTNKNMTTRLR